MNLDLDGRGSFLLVEFFLPSAQGQVHIVGADELVRSPTRIDARDDIQFRFRVSLGEKVYVGVLSTRSQAAPLMVIKVVVDSVHDSRLFVLTSLLPVSCAKPVISSKIGVTLEACGIFCVDIFRDPVT